MIPFILMRCRDKLPLFLLVFLLIPRLASATEAPPVSRITIHEIRLGVLAHDKDGLWSGSRVEDGTDYNAEIVFLRPSFKPPLGIVRPNLGATINSGDGTSKAYAGLDWNFDLSRWFFMNLGTALAVHNGNLKDRETDKKALGTRFLFRTMVELGVKFHEHHRLSIAFAHISNAGLANPNDGLDTLGVRYTYRY